MILTDSSWIKNCCAVILKNGFADIEIVSAEGRLTDDGESFIIDTDHWRHFWLMLGTMWGMFVAAERWKAGANTALTVPAKAS